jgi:hypothetical protein
VINSTGQIDAAQGNLADCVRVDGSSGPCGSTADPGPGFVDHEVPAGLVNSSNATFTLASAPVPASSLMVYRNGLLMRSGLDFNLSGSTVKFTVASVPQTGDNLLASYRTAPAGTGGGGGGAGGLTAAGVEVLCEGNGLATASTAFATLGTCVIPSGKLQAGDRVEVKFIFGHIGSTVPVQVKVFWNSQPLMERGVISVESTLIGTVDLSVTSSNAADWVAESRGTTEANLVSSGGISGSMGAVNTVILQGLLGISSPTESIRLRHFSVIRYAATQP